MGRTALRSDPEGQRTLLSRLSLFQLSARRGGCPQRSGWWLLGGSSPEDGQRVRLADVLDLVLPLQCSGCDAPGAALCSRCAEQLSQPAQAVAPRPAPSGFPRCHAVAAYDGAVRATLLAYKERGRRQLRRPLGTALAAAVTAGLPAPIAGPVLLLPVPSRRRAVRQRGTDTTKVMAIEAVRYLRRCGVDAVARPALSLRRATSDSAGLTAAARAVNLSGAMSAEVRLLSGLRSAAIVIVDDLLTTGATLAEAARALAAVERPATAAAVVATTLRKGVGFAGSPR